MSNAALRMLLWFLGQCIAQGSRFMPSVRSQITRTLIFELSAGDRVARHWVFDGQLRRATTYSGHAAAPDCSVHIGSSWQALRTLSSPRTVDKIVRGLHDGTVELHGSAFVLLWFYGLTRKFVKIGRASGPRYRIPDAYTVHDPAVVRSRDDRHRARGRAPGSRVDGRMESALDLVDGPRLHRRTHAGALT